MLVMIPGTPAFKAIHQSCHTTGSNCAAAIGIGKYKSRTEYKNEKKGKGKKVCSGFQQDIMDYGLLYEHVPIKVCRSFYNNVISPAPFFYLMDDKRFGATPDGLIGDDTVLEVKCPITKKIYPELQDEKPFLPLDHFCQVMMEMACAQRSKSVYICWTPLEIYIAELTWDLDVWTEIYGYLLLFSEILTHDLDARMKKGEKARLIKVFTEHSQKLTKVLLKIKNETPVWDHVVSINNQLSYV